MPLLLSSNLRPYPLVLLPLPLGVGRYYRSSRVLTCLRTFSLVFTHSYLDALPLG